MLKRLIGLSLCVAIPAAHAANRGEPLRVQVSYQLSVSMSRDDTVEVQQATILRTHGVLYAMASKECDQMRIALPGDCRMVNLNLTNAPQYFNGQSPFTQFGANATFELMPQGAETPAARGIAFGNLE